MFKKVRDMIAAQLNANAAEITEDTRFKEDLGADSLELFELVMTLEDEYSIEIPQDELERFKTVGAVVEFLKEQGIEL
ncbi:MAG: acyl carrier protein [Eubacteriales bacterium]